MLDLAKPYGIHEGLIFYGDHEVDNIVYYFPDEVSLAPQKAPDGSATPFYELFLQIFSEGDVVEGGLEDLRKTAGSILSLGIQCTVAPKRLEQALQKLKASGSFPENLSASIPPWKDGTVNLIVLDAVSGKNESMGEEAFVKSIVGANKPSLMSTDLKSVFNVRLDRKGTALINAALDGDTGNVAGILYDLRYAAIRPSLDLRIWANLGRCYDSVSHQLGIKAEFTYGVKFSLGAELNWLTKKMEEDGDLKIEVLSQAEDVETKRMIDEMVKDFKESILREMFRPYVNPQLPSAADAVAAAAQGAQSVIPVVGVSYKFTKEKISHEKVIEVDYRERSAVVRTHNPQSHLWVLGRQIGEHKKKYIQQLRFGDIWREQALSIRLVNDFADPKNDLLSAEVVIWRSKHGLEQNVSEGRFALPQNADPIKNLTFHKDSNGQIEIAWLYDRDEPVGYYYQIRFLYSGRVEDISSPSEIVTQPVFSTNQSLIIFPDTYTFFKTIDIREGNISFDEFKSVDVTLKLKNENDDVLDTEVFTLNAETKSAVWTVRGKNKNALFIESTKEYHYNDERPSIKTEPVYLPDDELIINKPFRKSTFSLIPVISGRNESIKEILLEISIDSPLLDNPIKELHRIKGPQFEASEIKIKLHSEKDELTYEAKAISADGKIIPINKGGITSNALIVDLNRTTQNEVTFIWKGRSPVALGLKHAKIELRKTAETPVELDGIEFKGDDIPDPVKKVFSANDKIQWRLLKRFENGTKAKTDFQPIETDTIVINAEQ